MSGSSSPAGQSISTQDSSPWAAQQPYLTEGFERAKTDVLNAPSEFYPNSTVVPMHGDTTAGLGAQRQRALSGDPTVQAGAQNVQQTASGDYLAQGNPYLQNAITNATQPIAQQFSESTIPSIQSGFSGKGRYGSGMQAFQQQRAGEAAMDQMGKVATSMGAASYGDERGRMMQAAQLAPEYGQESYRDAANLQNVGQAYENQAGANLQEDINRFQQDQNAPKQALGDYMSLIGGGNYGSSQTTSSPIYRNKTADILGGAATAAGIGGTLFGQGGIWPA